LPIILYGIVAGASIDQLFVAGILPGMLFLFVLAGYSFIVGFRNDVRRTAFDRGEALRSIWAAKWELMVPVVVIVAIYGVPGVTSGLVTIAEASAICALYLLIIEVFVYKDIKLWTADESQPNLGRVIREAMVMVGAIMIILGVALGLTNYLVQEEVPMKILAAIQDHIRSRFTFLILLTIFLLLVGCLMDIFSAIIVVVPLIIPIAAEYGVHPVHLGVIFLANLEIGYITPPVGLNLFISSLAFEKPVVQLYRMALPFLFLMLLALLVITFNEDLSLWLVRKWAPDG
jgi:tripartite ATP-independent transporter DctM subunit